MPEDENISPLTRILSGMRDLPEFSGYQSINIDTVGNFGNSPLHVSALQGDVPAAEILLKHGANPNKGGECGFTPLHDAVAEMNKPMISLLLSYGGKLDVLNKDNQSPIDLAQLLFGDAAQYLFQ